MRGVERAVRRTSRAFRPAPWQKTMPCCEESGTVPLHRMAPPVSFSLVGGGGGGRWWRARHGAARVHAGDATPATIARGHAPRVFRNMGTNSNSKAATVVAAVDNNSNSKVAKVAATVAAPAATTAPAMPVVATGAVGTTLAAGMVATVHGVAFAAPVAGVYHAPRGANAGWPAVPAGSAVHACDAVQVATATTPAMPATVVVHGQPAHAGTTGGGAVPGHYIARPYTGGQRWQLHPGAPKV